MSRRNQVKIKALATELRALLDDGQPHHRSELLGLARRHGGGAKQYRRAVAGLKSGGYYAGYIRGGYYAHRTLEQDTTRATRESLRLRSVPELIRRIRAHRGEMIRAGKRGENLQPYIDALAMFESTLASIALAAGLSPSEAMFDTLLTADEELAIKAEP